MSTSHAINSGSLGATREPGATVIDLDLRRAAAAELATRAKAGSDAAFQELTRRLTPLMRFIAARYYLPDGDADDLHQEALFGLHKAVRDYRPERNDSFDHFAALCIRRQVITRVKEGTRAKHQPLNRRADLHAVRQGNVDNPEPEDRLGAFLDLDSDPHDVLTRQEDFDTFVRLASGTLSIFEGEVFGLWLSGVSYGDIAKRTNSDHKSVDNAMQRCKRKLTDGMAAAA